MLTQIIYLFAWPVVILAAWLFVRWMLGKFESNNPQS
jgi:hypothetical protein